MHARSAAVAIAASLLAALAACGDSSSPSGPEQPAAVASVSVSHAALALTVGTEATLTATPKDARGAVLSGRQVEWSSTNEAVATVSQGGVVHALAAGQTTIRARSEGKQGSAQVTVNAPPPAAVARVELDATALALDEDATRQLVATPRAADDAPLTDRAVQWVSSDETVARVSGGLVTAVREGTATITATSEGKTAQATVRVTFNTAFDLLYDRWDVLFDNYAYPELYRLDLRSGVGARLRHTTYTNADASPSPDGTKLAVVGADGGRTRVFIIDADGNGLRYLVAGESLEDQPAWSPDGSRIAFRRWAPGGPPGVLNRADIWVANADGSNAVNLTATMASPGSAQRPTWSHDGQRIAFAYETQGAEGYVYSRIMAMRADGGDKYPVSGGGHYDDQPSWSPNGQSIVFTRSGGEYHGELIVASAAGGSERRLLAADLPDVQKQPAWSPDGKLVAFASNHEIIGTRAGDFHIYTVRADGTGMVRRTEGGADRVNPSWIRR